MTTMRDVAVHAGVSYSTVSYVLNGRHAEMRISGETRARVLRSARELGYRRNELARAMVTGRSRILGFLVPHSEEEWIGRVLAGALEAADEAGHFLKVWSHRAGRLDRGAIDRCLALRLAGVVVVHLDPDSLEVLGSELERADIPLVHLDHGRGPAGFPRVGSDDARGVHLAVRHLLSLGHRRIALVNGNPGGGVSAVREAGYRAGLAEAGLPVDPDLLVYGRWSPSVAESATCELLRLPDRPTAVVTASDQTALVVMRTARRLGFGVPEKLSVVGFANFSFAELADPPLSTVAQPFHAMGRAAVEAALRTADAGRLEHPPVTELLPTTLVVRESTAPPE